MPAAKSSSEPRDHRDRCVAQTVAAQIEGQHRQEDGEPRPDRHPRSVDETALRGIEHTAP